MEATAQRSSLAELAAQIAAHLDGFAVEPESEPRTWYARLVHADGRTISLNSSRNGTGRLAIHGSYPRDGQRYMSARDWGAVPYNETAPEITVSATRPPAVIAADIQRRFLGRYSAIYADCLRRKAVTDEDRGRTAALVDELAGILGVQLQRPNDPERRGFPIYCDGRNLYGDITVSTESVSMDLRSVPVELARRIARLVAEG